MRTIVFLKNNPVVEDALEQESSPPVDRPEIAIHTKKERAREIFFFSKNYSKYLRSLFTFTECLENTRIKNSKYWRKQLRQTRKIERIKKIWKMSRN